MYKRQIQVIAQFGDVGRMEVDEKTFYLVGVFLLNKVFNVVNVFLVHLLVNYKLQITNYNLRLKVHLFQRYFHFIGQIDKFFYR